MLAAGDHEVKRVVTGSEVRDGRTVVSIGQVGPDRKAAPAEVVEMSAGGLLWLAIDGSKFEQPTTTLKLPYVVGATWDISAVAGTGFRLSAKPTAAGAEDVIIPAGKYHTIRVDWDGKSSGRPLKSSLWYAAGVGIVKMTVGEQVMELRSFTPAK